MKTIAAILLMTTAVHAQEVRTRTETAKQIFDIDERLKAVEARPASRTCFEMQIIINTDLGIETAKSIRAVIEDGIPRIIEACRAAGVP